MDVDILIRNGMIADGTGTPLFPADLAIHAGKIAALGRIEGCQAGRVVDATGLVVAPGFIDIHTHADLELMVNPRLEAKTMQGVTTEVFSNCGLGFAPVASQKALTLQRKYLKSLFGESEDVTWNWTTAEEFLECYKGRTSVNVAYLVPHGALRASAAGWQDRPVEKKELGLMDSLLRDAMDSGAWGLSTGLFYRPMNSATQEECIALSRTVAEYGGFLAIHLRDYHRHLIDSFTEAVQISQESGVRLQISHLQAPGKLNRGKRMGERLMSLMDEARRTGLDVMCDLYPYTAGCSMLSSLLPSSVTSGDFAETMLKLRDPMQRALISTHFQAKQDHIDFSQMCLCGFRTSQNRSFEGQSVVEIARRKGKSIPDSVCDLLAEEEMEVAYIAHQSSEEDLQVILSHPSLMIGSDAVHLKSTVHPRVFGTYPRMLAEYVRRQKLLSLEEAVRKMSAMPAERLGLTDRGYVRCNLAADLVLFDPDTVSDLATYENPRQFPLGIPYVLVNGKFVKDRDQNTGELPGCVLTRLGVG